MSYLNHPAISQLLSGAIERTLAEMQTTAPYMSQYVSPWIKELTNTQDPTDYFKYETAFPMVLFCWWFENMFTSEPDWEFQADLTYAYVNVYYFIRMIDNIMDGEQTVEAKLLPALGFFHTQWQMAFQRYFEFGHPFWESFKTIWFQACEIVIRDGLAEKNSYEYYRDVSGRKVYGARIPILAICYRYGQPGAFDAWEPVLDEFGRWHQMHNDIFGWMKDYQNRTPTYFLFEAEQRKQPDESIPTWVLREGFEWGASHLQQWMADIKKMASILHHAELIEYLEWREKLFLEQYTDMKPRLSSFVKLIEALQMGANK